LACHRVCAMRLGCSTDAALDTYIRHLSADLENDAGNACARSGESFARARPAFPGGWGSLAGHRPLCGRIVGREAGWPERETVRTIRTLGGRVIQQLPKICPGQGRGE